MDIKVKWDCPKRTDVIMSIKYLSDSELLERISQKDYNAFDELWRRYNKIVLSMFRNLLRDKHFAEDAHQRLFMTIWKNSHNYRGGNVKSYIQGIVRNIYKQVVCENTVEIPISTFSEDRYGDVASGFVTFGNNYNSEDNCRLQKELETKIQKFIGTLPSHQKEILTLRIESDLTWKEISERVRINKNTCSTIYRRLKARIKAILAKFNNE